MQYLLTREELDALKNNKAIRAEYARQVEDLKQAFVGDMRARGVNGRVPTFGASVLMSRNASPIFLLKIVVVLSQPMW
jgi:hypothetical protein